MFSNFFINRPIFAIVVAIIIVLAGLITLHVLPVTQYPNITPPTVQVSATYPGANAETVAQTVGIPIEQQVNGVDGMLYMSSTASSAGNYSLTITFAVGTDIDEAAVQVQNRINMAQGSLPEPVIEQGVSVMKRSSNIVMLLTLFSNDSIYDGLYLGNYASLNLINPLTRVQGVGSVEVMGGGDYSMRVWLDPEAMRIRNITPQDVYTAIEAQNMEVSAGYVGQSIGNNSDNAFQYTLNVQGRLTSPEEFGNIILKSKDNGMMLRLKDIAKVEVGTSSYGVSSNINGKSAAAIAIYQLPNSNSLDVANGIEEEMKALAQNLPSGVEYQVTLDTTTVMKASIDEVLSTLIKTTLLVIFVIWLFLQNWRAVIIPCLSIPVSLIGTLAIMYALGFSINTLTLFGLILAIAIVVDDAIVVVENSSRLLETGKYSGKEAVKQAMSEIVGPIVGVVLVLLAVFIPTTFIGGITGQLYKQFALTIAASTLLSGINSLTLTPALCGLFLKKSEPSDFLLFKGFNKFYNKTQSLYDKVVGNLLTRPAIAFSTYIIIAIAAILLFVKWPSTFIPQEDDGYFIAAVQLPPASSLERTQEVGKQVEKILASYPEVTDYVAISGFSMMGGGQEPNAATYFVTLKNWKERKGKEHSVQAIVDRFDTEANAIQEAQIFAMVPPAIPGLGNSSGLELQLEDKNNLGSTEMQKAIDLLMETYHTKPEIASLSTMYQANVPQYSLNIDRNKAEFMGVQINDIFKTLSYYMGAAYVNDYVQFGHIYEVQIEAGEKSQKNINDVLKLTVQNSDGKMVPFSSFTEIQEKLGMDNINRYNMYSTAAITCNVAAGSSSSNAIIAMQDLVKEQLGNQFGYEWTSMAYQEMKSDSSTSMIFILALLVVFLVLAAQYESWTSPISAIIGLPVALLGAIIGCWIMGIPVSIYTQIGIILLIALSAKNGILIVAFARDFHAQGNTIREAALEGGHVRLRPILMTSFAFIFGIMPLLFASGAGAASRISLGTAVVFGMIMNTLLATVYIPNFYELMQKIQEKNNSSIEKKGLG